MNEHVDTALTQAMAQATTASEKVDALFEMMQRCGQSFYDESVTQLEHALQAANLARNSNASDQQISSALLHDIGHFLMDEHDQHSDFLEEDWEHETVGAEVIEPFFGEAITEPIRLHVPAKRYLCTVDSNYYGSLSRASKRSFELQGGKMSDPEIKAFESNPFHKPAVLLRRWDDGAKVKSLDVPGLESYRSHVEACL